jgi:hypothetical protein
LVARRILRRAHSDPRSRIHGCRQIEQSQTAKLLDHPNVWKAIKALARFIENNYEGDGCYGALGTGFQDPSEDSAAIKLLKSMDLPSLAYA